MFWPVGHRSSATTVGAPYGAVARSGRGRGRRARRMSPRHAGGGKRRARESRAGSTSSSSRGATARRALRAVLGAATRRPRTRGMRPRGARHWGGPQAVTYCLVKGPGPRGARWLCALPRRLRTARAGPRAFKWSHQAPTPTAPPLRASPSARGRPAGAPGHFAAGCRGGPLLGGCAPCDKRGRRRCRHGGRFGPLQTPRAAGGAAPAGRWRL